ncbi:uncharacterized protein LOC126686240 [Mercurialis annua]|uniref:uncharacterized protein LOC126686240 n=1 Tax=Mercurialis annua TaxID=3986 RepID=UPI00215ECD5F|nr:uncharacterized protein LOC126686240 [Mercurialis annua]
MASSFSSAMLIIVSFSVFVLAANAMRDMPNATYVPEKVSSTMYTKIGETFYQRVATLRRILVKSKWKGECFTDSSGWFSTGTDRSIFWVYVSGKSAKSIGCTDSYAYFVGGDQVQSATVFTSLKTSEKTFLTNQTLLNEIYKSGIQIFMKKTTVTSDEESGQDGIKQVVETY